MELGDIDLDTRTQEILLAASNHDLERLKPFLRVPGAANVQDSETGMTPLHAAISACGGFPSLRYSDLVGSAAKIVGDSPVNGQLHEKLPLEDESGEGEEIDIEKAKGIIRELFLAGAIWNDLDANNETPGCLAWRLEQKELYELVVEAGVRAELLMNLMGGYELLADEDDEEERKAAEVQGEEAQRDPGVHQLPNIAPQTTPTEPKASIDEPDDVNSKSYLSSTLTFTPSALLDASSNSVMMTWETDIMERTCTLLAPTSGLRILNIGFGLGIIDRLFAATSPSAHHIIEAHPSVLAALNAPDADSTLGIGPAWSARAPGKNVIHSGRWQDVVPQLLAAGEVFDVIYFDTFGESYTELKQFFSEYVIGLLDQWGRFGFFNGLGADRRVCYDVYCRVVELDLCDAGLDVEWTDVDVDLEGQGLGKEGEGEWEGVRRRYWTLERYRLPVCTFMG
jgi:type IV protein arginine methyltransferase